MISHSEIAAMIQDIPSVEGWSDERMELAYCELAERMIEFGVPAQHAADILTEAFAYAMAELAAELRGE